MAVLKAHISAGSHPYYTWFGELIQKYKEGNTPLFIQVDLRNISNGPILEKFLASKRLIMLAFQDKTAVNLGTPQGIIIKSVMSGEDHVFLCMLNKDRDTALASPDDRDIMPMFINDMLVSFLVMMNKAQKLLLPLVES